MYKKILISFMAILLLCISLLTFQIYDTARESYYDETENYLRDVAEHVAGRIKRTEDFEAIRKDDYYRDFDETTRLRLTLIDKNGKVQFDSKETYSQLDNHGNRPEVKGALQGEISMSTRYSKTLDVDMMYVATPIYVGDQVIGTVRTSISLNCLENIMSGIVGDVVISILITLFIGFIIFSVLIQNIRKPLNETAVFAKEIAQGNYQKRISIIQDDEIGSLAESLNNMAERLEFSFEKLSERNFQLESVLTNVKSGLIATDQDQDIILINNSAINMLNLSKKDNIKGQNVLVAFRKYELYTRIVDFDYEYEDMNAFESNFDGKLFSIYVKKINYNNYINKKGLLIVIDDITQMRKYENLRRDFVANVTHELKTPITSIKGFIETLSSGGVEDEVTRQKFYNIIESEANRLTHLVNDILTLSTLDSQATIAQSEQEIINVRLFMDGIYSLLINIAQDKGVHLSIYVNENIKEVYFNSNHLKQLMINLIDNAIKYSKENGYVNVNIYPNGDNAIIEVRDNGIGIPKKDLPRIFERFYRVDKGRSREAGGTGLGLAIVKHIVQVNNSKIRVESIFNKGTTFYVEIPMHTEEEL